MLFFFFNNLEKEKKEMLTIHLVRAIKRIIAIDRLTLLFSLVKRICLEVHIFIFIQRHIHFVA
jgi:hypothetical protein